MSGVETTQEPKENQEHRCTSCVTSVVQTFNHFQEQIDQLVEEKLTLEAKLKRLAEEWEHQKQAMTKQINELEQKLSELK
jgi:hypothetical protein